MKNKPINAFLEREISAFVPPLADKTKFHFLLKLHIPVYG